MKCFKDFSLISGCDETALTDAWMLTDQGRILEIGTGEIPERITQPPSASIEIFSLDGKYIMPGMFDCHTHIGMYMHEGFNLMEGDDTERTVFILKNLQAYLNDGVTFIRDLGAIGNTQTLTIKKLLAAGVIEGPHIYTAGPMLCVTGGHGHHFGSKVCDGVVEVKKATRQLVQDGVDLIKVAASGGGFTKGNDVRASQFDQEEIEAIVHEANKRQKKVAAHAHGTEAIKNAVRAGVASIEHGTFLDDEGVYLMSEHNTWLVPTFTIGKACNQPVPPHTKEVKKAYDAGIRIAAGTDITPTIVPHNVAWEIQELAKYTGMSNLEAIQTATRNAAQLLGVDADYGTLEAGKYADFIVLNENPLEDLSAPWRPQQVYLGGVRKK